jgi:hypothetical protein
LWKAGASIGRCADYKVREFAKPREVSFRLATQSIMSYEPRRGVPQDQFAPGVAHKAAAGLLEPVV